MKETLYLDKNNLYVQGLMKVIHQFIVEEAAQSSYAESRLKSKIEKLKELFPEERKSMVISDERPVFGTHDSTLFDLLIINY